MDIKLIGAQIKAARKQQGLSLKDLSEKVDVHFTQISRMERGAGVRLSKNLRKVCNFLQVPLIPEGSPASVDDLAKKVQDLVNTWPQSEMLIRSVVEALEVALASVKAAGPHH